MEGSVCVLYKTSSVSEWVGGEPRCHKMASGEGEIVVGLPPSLHSSSVVYYEFLPFHFFAYIVRIPRSQPLNSPHKLIFSLIILQGSYIYHYIHSMCFTFHLLFFFFNLSFKMDTFSCALSLLLLSVPLNLQQKLMKRPIG